MYFLSCHSSRLFLRRDVRARPCSKNVRGWAAWLRGCVVASVASTVIALGSRLLSHRALPASRAHPVATNARVLQHTAACGNARARPQRLRGCGLLWRDIGCRVGKPDTAFVAHAKRNTPRAASARSFARALAHAQRRCCCGRCCGVTCVVASANPRNPSRRWIARPSHVSHRHETSVSFLRLHSIYVLPACITRVSPPRWRLTPRHRAGNGRRGRTAGCVVVGGVATIRCEP